MSQAKRMMEEQEHQYNVATEIAIQAGVVGRCDFHGTVEDGHGDVEEALAFARSKWKKYASTFESVAELRGILKKVIEEAALECGRCADIRAA